MSTSFQNSFYAKHAVMGDGQPLLDKFNVVHIESGCTPDGYEIQEALFIQKKKGALGYIQILPSGCAVYTDGINETDIDPEEAYVMFGIDTASKQFKDFQEKIKNSESFNAETVCEMLATTPQLTTEKQIEKLNSFT